MVGKKLPLKKTVFKDMLAMLHSQGFVKFVKTGENLGKRFNRYISKWKEASAMKNDSGAGLTVVDLWMGITLDDKLEKICPHFERMNALYGERANAAPPALSQSGIPGQPEGIHDPGYDDEEPHENNAGEKEDKSEMPVDDGPETKHEGVINVVDKMDESTRSDIQPQATERGATNRVTPGTVNEESQAMPTPAANEERRVPNNRAAPPPGVTVKEESQATPTPAANEGRLVPNKRAAPPPSQARSRTNMADLCLDKVSDKSIYRREMIQTKDKRRAQRRHEEKRARLEYQHQLDVIEHMAILTALVGSNRSVAEIKSLLNLFSPLRNNVNPAGLVHPLQCQLILFSQLTYMADF